MGGVVLIFQAVIVNKRAKAMEETSRAQADAARAQATDNQMSFLNRVCGAPLSFDMPHLPRECDLDFTALQWPAVDVPRVSVALGEMTAHCVVSVVSMVDATDGTHRE